MNRNIIATILIVLAVGTYFTVTENVLAQASAVKTVNDQYLSAIDSAQKLVAVRDQVLNDYKNLSQNDRDRLTKMVPNTVDNIRLIIDLENIAASHGFALNGITAQTTDTSNTPAPGTTAPTTGAPPVVGAAAATGAVGPTIVAPILDTVTVSFTVNAPYLQFISFMQDLEANLRIMDMTHLSMTAASNGVYTFQVTLRTYWLREQ
ncbi:MAG: hypothetical protein KGI59_01910 [Patescibacteria group bacterium]|nr:hypothetical protein [Patescibacteria group bacterium]MDE2172653.1 hypothetical protein [Patescibacteria group bacterium]